MAIKNTTHTDATDAKTVAGAATSYDGKIKLLSSFTVPCFDGEEMKPIDPKKFFQLNEWKDTEKGTKGAYLCFLFNGKTLPFTLFTKSRIVIDAKGEMTEILPKAGNEFVTLLQKYNDPTNENDLNEIIKWFQKVQKTNTIVFKIEQFKTYEKEMPYFKNRYTLEVKPKATDETAN